ncbi:MAG TPA: glycoside hydrolase family 31 protein [Chitinophagaceae bacterium]|nr:glycoside hydrolase family 31 protein [Chitinophagaceae bacterium]
MQPMIQENKYSIKYFPDAVQHWEKEGNAFYFHTSETILEVKIVSDRIIRFRYAADGIFKRDFSYAIVPELKEAIISFEIKELDDAFVIATSKVNVLIEKENMKITISDKKGNLINKDEVGFHWQYYLQKGGKIVYCSKQIQEGECFYGLGDKPTDLNLQGKRTENFGTDQYGFKKDTDPLYKNIPFYYGLHHGIGYGIFFDNTFRTLFDFGHERPEASSFWARGGQMTYYFIYGPELLQVAEQYTRITGTPQLPPLWALGYQQSRWSYFPDTRVKEIAAEFRNRHLPCDAIHLDIDYMEGFRCFTFSEENFPDPAALIGELAEKGFKIVAIIDPGIKADPDYWVYQQGVEKGHFCKRADGALMEGDVWPGKCVFPDFTNPEVRKWWGGLFKKMADIGVRGIWNDMNEPAVFEISTFPEDVRHAYDGDPCSHRKAHNVYGHMMSKATADGIKKHLMPHRPFVITRSCYSGAQRWTSVWTGDNQATWEHLWLSSVMCQRLAISGISFAGSDIGGFIGEPDGELYIRWLQLATFHPFMRTHSASNETNFDQDPWSFGTKVETIARKFLRLRYRLLPYLYTTFWQYATHGTPMLRPLCFVAQNDPNTYHRDSEFMLGDHLLISHVSEPGMTEKSVYLPEGEWFHYWTDQKFKGGREITVATPLNELPLFVKAGAVIPKYPAMEYVGEKPVMEMTLDVYYSEENCHGVLYEDAGDNYGYLDDQYNVIRFKQIREHQQLRFKKKYIGHYQTDYRKFRIIFHGVPFKATEYVVDGQVHRLGVRNFALGVVKIVVDRAFEEVVIR